MSTQPHDALFKAVFSQVEHARGLLMALVPPAFGDRVDWSTLETEPGSFIDPRLAHRRSDVLFTVTMRTGPRALLYVLIEHQSEPDPWMALRLHGYVHRVWEHWLRGHKTATRIPVVLPVVVHHGESGWTSATALSELYDIDRESLEPLAPYFAELRFLLDDLAPMALEQLEGRPMTDYGRLALLLLEQVRSSPDIVADLRRWMPMLARVLRGPRGWEALALLLEYIFAVRKSEPEGLPAALEAGLGSEAREAYMSFAQKLIDQGRTEGQAEMLLRLVAARFGPAPPSVMDRVRAASGEQLEIWAERILTAASVADVFRDE